MDTDTAAVDSDSGSLVKEKEQEKGGCAVVVEYIPWVDVVEVRILHSSYYPSVSSNIDSIDRVMDISENNNSSNSNSADNLSNRKASLLMEYLM